MNTPPSLSKKRAASLIASALVATSALPGQAVSAAPAHTSTGASWKPAIVWKEKCGNFHDNLGYQCGTLTVPMDWSKLSGPTVQLSVTRLKHTSAEADYQGVMLISAPENGRLFPFIANTVPAASDGSHPGTTYDWVGFDRRGEGASTPRLGCDDALYARPPGAAPPFVPTSRAIEQERRKLARQYSEDCGELGGDLLNHMTTLDSARDLDALRSALGASKTSIYAWSTGTYLAQVYSTVYPKRVVRLVMDSNVPASRVWEGLRRDQIASNEQAMKAWFAWVARYDSVYHLGSTAAKVEAVWLRLLDKLEDEPGVITEEGETTGVIGPAEFTNNFRDIAKTDSNWEYGAMLLSMANSGDFAYFGWQFGTNSQLPVSCTDAPWTTSWSKFRATHTALAKRYPLWTWPNAWDSLPCATWPAKAHKPVRVDGRKIPPSLLIGATLDGVIPFSGNLETRATFPTSRLVAIVGGRDHSASLTGIACVDNVIADYLADGSLPARVRGNGPDRSCKAPAAPVPTS